MTKATSEQQGPTVEEALKELDEALCCIDDLPAAKAMSLTKACLSVESAVSRATSERDNDRRRWDDLAEPLCDMLKFANAIRFRKAHPFDIVSLCERARLALDGMGVGDSEDTIASLRSQLAATDENWQAAEATIGQLDEQIEQLKTEIDRLNAHIKIIELNSNEDLEDLRDARKMRHEDASLPDAALILAIRILAHIDREDVADELEQLFDGRAKDLETRARAAAEEILGYAEDHPHRATKPITAIILRHMRGEA